MANILDGLRSVVIDACAAAGVDNTKQEQIAGRVISLFRKRAGGRVAYIPNENEKRTAGLAMIKDGKANKAIAAELEVNINTVRRWRASITERRDHADEFGSVDWML